MHPNAAFAWDDASALAFVAETAFAHVFAQTPIGPRVAHAPVLVDGRRLRFHLANRNALTPHLDGAVALASIGGPGAYVSPNWYANGAGQVPTWNYLAVEVEGPVRRLSDDELVDLLDASSALHEGRVGQDWTRAKMDPARFTAMCGAITGFELDATVIRATRKLSQNKSDADARGVAAGQAAAGQTRAAALIERSRGW
jgi:transcriptional regulator